MSKTRHNPVDIKFEYGAREFKKLNELTKTYISDYPEFLLLLSLYGFKHRSKIDLSKRDDNSESHEISRTVHQRAETFCESSYGLMTILDNLEQEYSVVINKLAFAKMTDEGKSFTQLPNVQTFYSYMLGGIKPMYNELFEMGDSEEAVARQLYQMVMESDEEVNQLIFELNQEIEENAEI